jgi:hypothetical protein
MRLVIAKADMQHQADDGDLAPGFDVGAGFIGDRQVAAV